VYFGKEIREQVYLTLCSHHRLHLRQAAGQRDMDVGSLIYIVGLTQAITLRFSQALLEKRGCNQGDELALS